MGVESRLVTASGVKYCFLDSSGDKCFRLVARGIKDLPEEAGCGINCLREPFSEIFCLIFTEGKLDGEENFLVGIGIND